MGALHYVIPSLVAAAFGVGGVVVTHKNLKPQIQYVQLKPSEVAPAASTRVIDKYRWQGLTQAEVDALTIATSGKNYDIVIACMDDSRCGDLALDFDNAFESAKLKSIVERPFIDDTKGIAISSQELIDIVVKTTRLRPTLFTRRSPVNAEGKPIDPPNRIVIAIGTK